MQLKENVPSERLVQLHSVMDGGLVVRRVKRRDEWKDCMPFVVRLYFCNLQKTRCERMEMQLPKLHAQERRGEERKRIDA